MKKLICTLALVTTSLFFQNCGTNMTTTALASEQENENALKTVVDDQAIIQPFAGEIPVLKLLSAQTLKLRFDGKFGEYLVDLKTGSASRGSAKAILPEKLRLQFIQTLANANLCEQAPKPSGIVCTAIYAAPYARLETAGSSMDLGTKTSGCTWVQDLCGQKKRDQLRNAIQNFIVLNEELSSTQ